MAWSPVAWAYKQVITSAKLQQMVDNLVAHDHRTDGTQGAPLVGEWVTPTGVVAPGSEWVLDRFRYRLLLGGALVGYDVRISRNAGGAFTFAAPTAPLPGNCPDTPILQGIPAVARPGQNQLFHGEAAAAIDVGVRVQTDGTLVLIMGTPGGSVLVGNTIALGATVWRG